jgi:hypothetical protein
MIITIFWSFFDHFLIISIIFYHFLSFFAIRYRPSVCLYFRNVYYIKWILRIEMFDHAKQIFSQLQKLSQYATFHLRNESVTSEERVGTFYSVCFYRLSGHWYQNGIMNFYQDCYQICFKNKTIIHKLTEHHRQDILSYLQICYSKRQFLKNRKEANNIRKPGKSFDFLYYI